MAINDMRPVIAAPYGAATQMTEAFSKLALDWWRAQSDRLFDETAPWNFGLYVARRMMDLSLRPVALTEEERDYKVEAQIPGIRPKDLDIRVSEGTLRRVCHKPQPASERLMAAA